LGKQLKVKLEKRSYFSKDKKAYKSLLAIIIYLSMHQED
jgi:hypothetical protein